jgi:hypothetical protein
LEAGHHGQSAVLCVQTALFDVLTFAANERLFLIYNIATLFNFPLCHTVNPKMKCFLSGLYTWMIAFVTLTLHSLLA